MSNQITISYGDTDESAELIDSILPILVEGGAVLDIETVQLGYEQVRLGFEKGFDREVLEKIRISRVLLKPIHFTTKALCEALEIPHVRETYGEPYTAQGYVSEEYAIFEPAEPNPQSMLNAALMALFYLGQEEAAKNIARAFKNAETEDGITAPDFAAKIIDELQK